MSAMLLTTLMSPSIALLRGSALVGGPRAPLVANMLRSRGGATMAVANAKTAPAAVPLTAATISASSADIASWSGDLLLLPCWEAAEKGASFELPAEVRNGSGAARDRQPGVVAFPPH
jgi:leucyl aminopeptidase